MSLFPKSSIHSNDYRASMGGFHPTLPASLVAAAMMKDAWAGPVPFLARLEVRGGRRDMAAFDVVVLGGGTAGVHVATEVAGGGKTVALVEAGLIGGESAYLACLPSNSLLLSASRGEPWEDAVARRAEVTGGLDDSAAAQRLNRAGVQVIRGTGRITAPGTVEVTRAQSATTTTLTYSDLVIATGCEPVAPPIEGLSDIPALATA